jgi:nitrite reductase/ring-hydroxylating ferredoxin subunit
MSSNTNYVFVANLNDVQAAGCTVLHLNGHTIALFAHDDEIYAVDNRCPHMGFPLDKGTVNNGILTCHWHHARFCLENGGTFDQWADDVRAFPVDVRDGANGLKEVWIDVAEYDDPRQHERERLQVGLERDIPLVMGKAVLVLLEDGGDPVEPFRLGLEFGTKYRRDGWRQGLTMHTCFMNMLPYLDAEDQPRALYHGLAAVARDSFGEAPRFPVRPLPHSEHIDIATLKTWFRQFIAVRDAEGAERCIVSAIRAGANDQQMADMLFSAITDYRYIDIGHPADFTNKAFEALDIAGWALAEPVLSSLVFDYAMGSRMEESNAWRNPVDLISILAEAFEDLPAAVEGGHRARADNGKWNGRDELISILHSDNPQDIVDALLQALRAGCTMTELAATVSYAAVLRIARFHTSNEFSDWDTALHTFSFANAIEQGLRRAPSVELLRGVFDAAMSVYLDRFLNIPAARIPQPDGKEDDPIGLLADLPALLDRQQQINQAADMVACYLYNDGQAEKLLAMMGKLLLREDRDFHTIQTVEGAFKQYARWHGTDAGTHALIAAGRYLAAHSPTVRAQEQTFSIAQRLHRGERLFEG